MADWRKMVSYRNRAEELRIMAEDFSASEPERMLRGVAEMYDRMADQLESSLKRTSDHGALP
jgi:hypothetical protein